MMERQINLQQGELMSVSDREKIKIYERLYLWARAKETKWDHNSSRWQSGGVAILGRLNEQQDIYRGVKNFLEPTQSPVRLVYRLYINQYMENKAAIYWESF